MCHTYLDDHPQLWMPDAMNANRSEMQATGLTRTGVASPTESLVAPKRVVLLTVHSWIATYFEAVSAPRKRRAPRPPGVLLRRPVIRRVAVTAR